MLSINQRHLDFADFQIKTALYLLWCNHFFEHFGSTLINNEAFAVTDELMTLREAFSMDFEHQSGTTLSKDDLKRLSSEANRKRTFPLSGNRFSNLIARMLGYTSYSAIKSRPDPKAPLSNLYLSDYLNEHYDDCVTQIHACCAHFGLSHPYPSLLVDSFTDALSDMPSTESAFFKRLIDRNERDLPITYLDTVYSYPVTVFFAQFFDVMTESEANIPSLRLSNAFDDELANKYYLNSQVNSPSGVLAYSEPVTPIFDSIEELDTYLRENSKAYLLSCSMNYMYSDYEKIISKLC